MKEADFESLPSLAADEALALIEGAPRSQWPQLVETWSKGDDVAAAELLELLYQGSAASVSTPRSEGEVLAGRYRLIAPVGQGVTGTVWRARDAKLERDVALKIFDAEPDRMLLARALQEARATADVVSEHVLRVYDVVEPGDEGPAFIVMELVQEFDAAKRPHLAIDLSKAKPHSIDEALRWASDGARGLAAAHTRAVFQRDVKLQNMLLTPVTRRVKVVDFGLATHQLNDTYETNSDRGSVTLIRNDGATIAGTPSCMSPEAARGLVADASTEEGRRVLSAVDVFGVGAALYELLSGRRLYETQAKGAAALAEVLDLAGRGPSFPLKLLHARFRISRRVERVVERALAIDPLERYPSVAELGDDLDALLESRPTSNDRSSYGLRAWLWNKRLHHLPVSTLFGTLVLATVASAAAALSTQLTQTAAELSHRREDLSQAKSELADFKKQLEEVRSMATSAEKSAIGARQERDKALSLARKNDEAKSEAERQRDESLFAKVSAEQERDDARAAQKTAEKERDDAKAARRQADRERDEAKAARRHVENDLEEAKSRMQRLEAERDELKAAIEPPAARKSEAAEEIADAGR